MIPFSILDLAPIRQGGTAAQSFAETRDLAQWAESLGYHRYWLAEHHNMTGIASAATSVLIGHVAGATSRIRVGAGGVMLPNHAPLVIAEQFGTLASLYPDRIDLGLGRAPGTDQRTAHALRRNLTGDVDGFPDDVNELIGYFAPARPGQAVQAVPGAGLDVAVWILGSSLYGAQLAAMMGLPYSFASHFAPAQLDAALSTYRRLFRASARLDKSRAMVAANVILADDGDEARLAATSQQQQFVQLIRNQPGQLPPPRADMESFWSPAERAHVEKTLSVSFVGSPAEVEPQLRAFIQSTGADELIVNCHVHDHRVRRRSLELLAQLRERV
ncbi:MAG: LLM class flavin-dependent oxidoreductase [Chiayiivirga sp.]|jgi:luciferase family oxidoreductase group 1|uniref:Luciferase-like monooxygenase n=1 Tax=Denitratimonas tolerans TaxID=1338420 RepID=A0AAW9R4B2_9GAMM|nr:LLM class flavin-dependent oxidoreductase [Xanthomonadaceae bacterium]MDX9764035.1 LLM class flavin-dependent oxidoreductase [Chiayiivirga sp.]HRO87567.1 LLM class flavin-dependent oxidoreductase [Chiayiivirga sp.]